MCSLGVKSRKSQFSSNLKNFHEPSNLENLHLLKRKKHQVVANLESLHQIYQNLHLDQIQKYKFELDLKNLHLC